MIDKENKIQEPIFNIEVDLTGLSRVERSKQRSIPVKRFIKYCSIYDPSVDLTTGTKIKSFINPDVLPEYDFKDRCDREQQINFLKNLIRIPSLEKLREQHIESRKDKSDNYSEIVKKAGKEIILYSCLAPYKILNENLFYKQYICCEHEGQKGWMVLPRNLKFNIYEFNKQLLGIGGNIIEADLDFQRKKGNLFLESMESNQDIVDFDIPLNIAQMKYSCKKYDENINLDSLKHKYITESGAKKFGFELFCKSEKCKFTVAVYPSSIKWTVQTYIEADFNIPIEATGKTLKEAFDKLREKHDNLSSDSEFIRKEVIRMHKKEMQEDYQESYREYKDIISEFGADIFPDRD